MAQLNGLIVTEDADFAEEIARRLRSGATPVRVIDESMAHGASPDIVVVDIRSSSSSMGTIEHLRGRWQSSAIFAVASAVDANLVIHAMRAGANEFLLKPTSPKALCDRLTSIMFKPRPMVKLAITMCRNRDV